MSDAEQKIRVQAHHKLFYVKHGRYDIFWKDLSANNWEPTTFAIFERFLDANHSYIDIGSWIGPTVLYGCQMAKRVYAVEPDLIAFDELKDNLRLNAPITNNVEAFNCGITECNGKMRLGNRAGGGDSMSSVLFSASTVNWEVEGVNFDSFVSANNISDCNFIKMDIEGGEYSVLPSMRSFIKKNQPTLFLSLHPLFLGDVAKVGVVAKARRAFARSMSTLKIVRAIACYKYIYDNQGNSLSRLALLLRCTRCITFELVATNVRWLADVPSKE